jgi:hypothetical protein
MAVNGNPLMEEAVSLAEGKWKKYMTGLTEGYKKSHNGQAPDSSILGTTALMLENTQKMIQRMDETTKVVNLGNFVDYGFGVITAVMPALVANEIVSVQPLKARTGEVFYLNFKYGSNKGTIKAGDMMISATTGATDDTLYSGQEVGSEEIGALTTGTNDYEFYLSYTPVTAGSLSLSTGSDTITDNGDGTLAGTGLTAGTIDYATGKINLTFASVAADATLSGSYSFQYGNMDVDGNIPQVDVDLASSTISSTTRSLRARWMFDAAFELLQVHGINSDEEIAKAMAAEIRHEIDGEIMNDLWRQAQAGGAVFNWSKTPGTGVSYKDHKDTFVDTLISMSNAIFKDTMRAEGNFVVAGINVASLIESIGDGRFVASADGIKPGPHVIGTLDGRWKIIKNPFYEPDSFVVGYKGGSYLEGGYVYAPFLPLYTTPTMMLDDFVNRKGCRTIYGKKMLNPHFYAKGRIVN